MNTRLEAPWFVPLPTATLMAIVGVVEKTIGRMNGLSVDIVAGIRLRPPGATVYDSRPAGATVKDS